MKKYLPTLSAPSIVVVSAAAIASTAPCRERTPAPAKMHWAFRAQHFGPMKDERQKVKPSEYRSERIEIMKTSKLLVALLLLGVAGIGNAWDGHGHGGHGHFGIGVVIGPGYGPWYYPPPAYYYPPYYPPVVIERQAPVYVEQQPNPAEPPAPAAAAPANYWYYCAAARGYYPYVKECPGGWQRVSPQPPN